MSKKKILIIGCGWAGMLTAERFLKQGATVWASTTQESKLPVLEEKGIHPLLLDFSQAGMQTENLRSLEQTVYDLILISVPVRRNEDPERCFAKFQQLTAFLTPLRYKKILYLSSIGVYEPLNGPITEQSAVKQASSIFLVEEYLKQQFQDLVIFRLGGLFGYGRIPGRYFSNKITTVGNEKANYVHGTDVSRAILEALNKELPAGLYNLVAPLHPLKKTIYEKMAQKYSFLPVLYADEVCVQKEVSSDKLINALQFSFEQPSPLDF